MKTKILSIIIAISAALALTACGEPEESSAPANSASSQSSSSGAAGDTPTSSESSSGDNITSTASVKIDVISDGEVNIVVNTDFLKSWGEGKVVCLTFRSGEPGPDTEEIMVCRLESTQRFVSIPEGDYIDGDPDVPESFPDGTVTWNVYYEGIEQLLRSSKYIELHTEDYTGENVATEQLIEINDASEIAGLFVGGGSSGSSSDAGNGLNFSYQYIESENQFFINSYYGTGELVIPNELDGKPVTYLSLGSSDMEQVTSITLPDTLEKICDCRELQNIMSITFPASMRVIEGKAFSGCRKLTSIKLNEGLERIEGLALAETGCARIDLPSSLSSLDATAFFSTTKEVIVTYRGVSYHVNPETAEHDNDIYELLAAVNG